MAATPQEACINYARAQAAVKCQETAIKAAIYCNRNSVPGQSCTTSYHEELNRLVEHEGQQRQPPLDGQHHAGHQYKRGPVVNTPSARETAFNRMCGACRVRIGMYNELKELKRAFTGCKRSVLAIGQRLLKAAA